ncbi:hypothetical protein [Sphingomonas endophytica]|uniref:Tail protein n=1 Tax=Sphingomonas endophytica TaxID=869719 RepID=A0A147I3F3_9SPHN|nr:hypothetical protein [Sphingomonas endophytica]KTT72621.1 hypothetical protein NS334_08480 [Sphingomonas endophytica]
MTFRRHVVRGSGRVRKLLRRLPEAVRHEIIVELSVTGRRILAAVRARAPRKSGRLIAGLTQKILTTTLRLQVGLIGSPRGRAKLFYGRIQDLGRTEQIVRVTRHIKARTLVGNNRNGGIRRTVFHISDDRLRRRGPNKGTPIGSPYQMRVRAMEGKRFVTGRYRDLRAELSANLRGIYARALQTIGGRDGD